MLYGCVGHLDYRKDTMNTTKRLLAFLALSILPLATKAQTQQPGLFSLSPTVITTPPGSLLDLTGTITNNTGQTIYPEGGGWNLSGPGNTSWSVNDSAFLNGLPTSMAPNAMYANTIALTVPSNETSGVYLFTYTVSVDAPAGIPAYTGSASAQITVMGVPEASSLLSAGLALGMGGLMLRRWGRQNSGKG